MLQLWNPATRQPIGAPLQTDPKGVYAVAFSANGQLLASADGNGTLLVWNPATGRPVGAPIKQSGGIVGGMALSPNGKLLAAPGGDGTVWLWNPATGRPVGVPLHVASAPAGVSEVAFSPNGQLLASAQVDGTVRLWRVSLFTHPYEALCTYVGPPTPQDWHEYAAGEPQPQVCT